MHEAERDAHPPYLGPMVSSLLITARDFEHGAESTTGGRIDRQRVRARGTGIPVFLLRRDALLLLQTGLGHIPGLLRLRRPSSERGPRGHHPLALRSDRGWSMSVRDRIAESLAEAVELRSRSLRSVIERCVGGIGDLEAELADPGVFPYGRIRLNESDRVEAIMMNWARGKECAPHDHGRSRGCVWVVEGVASHTVYRLSPGGVPIPGRTKLVRAGRWLDAPRGMVHSMGNPTSDRLVTLHLYWPPISGMKVYDVARCLACVVRDDCGAWLPPPAQVVEYLQLPAANDTVRSPGR